MISVALLMGMALVIGGGLAFAQKKPSPASNSPTTNYTSAPDLPIIGHIEKQSRTITIKAGPKSTVYSVKSADGKILCNNLTLEQLRVQAPELHQFVKTAVVGNISNGASADSRLRITDAGVR